MHFASCRRSIFPSSSGYGLIFQLLNRRRFSYSAESKHEFQKAFQLGSILFIPIYRTRQFFSRSYSEKSKKQSDKEQFEKINEEILQSEKDEDEEEREENASWTSNEVYVYTVISLCTFGAYHSWQRHKAEASEQRAQLNVELPTDKPKDRNPFKNKNSDSSQVYAMHSWKLEILKRLPLRMTSFLFGHLASIPIPHFARGIVYGRYASIYRCKLDEMDAPLESYRSFSEFFTRRLKSGVRPISPDALVSPVDGVVLHFGKVEKDTLEQVKGISYSLGAFIGKDFSYLLKSKFQENIQTFSTLEKPENDEMDFSMTSLLMKSKNSHQLYHCVLYLAPGDYHGFHSPADCAFSLRRHFPGRLLPVAPYAVNCLKGLFALNERVALCGTWSHGFLSMIPVGATNVGSIKLKFDQDLKTNGWFRRKDFYERSYPETISLKKGEEIGFFHLGSTVVLIFESPEFVFTVQPNQRIKLGEKLGVLKRASEEETLLNDVSS